MARYYVNDRAQSNGDREAHKDGRSYMPSAANRTYLGEFGNCRDAGAAARRHYAQCDGCYYCSNACHTSWGSPSFTVRRVWMRRMGPCAIRV